MKKLEDTEQYKKGLIGEEIILQQVKKIFPKALKVDGYFKFYDIEIPEKKITLEIKTDFLSSTGNVYIEFSCNGADSGIFATKANIWVHIIDDKKHWIYTKKLKSCIYEHNCFNHISTKKIDSLHMQGFLIPTFIFQQYCFAIQDLTEEQICQLN